MTLGDGCLLRAVVSAYHKAHAPGDWSGEQDESFVRPFTEFLHERMTAAQLERVLALFAREPGAVQQWGKISEMFFPYLIDWV